MRNKSEKQPGVPDELLISQAKAAEMCGMTREAIHDLVSRGRLQSLEVEGRDLVYLKEVVDFSREHDERGARGISGPGLDI
jgi:hypothetical protein